MSNRSIPDLYGTVQIINMDQARKDQYLNDSRAVAIREKYPALKQAWEEYKMLWALSVTEDDLDPYLEY